jgi:hypothetical protein
MLLGIAFFSCSAQEQQQEKLPLDGNYYTVDLDAKKKKEIPLSSLFGKVSTIILETANNCLIGHIDELQVFDGRIYALDEHIAKSLFIFDMDGRFVRKIGGLGKGPGEYLMAADFTIDTENGFIYLFDPGQGNLIHKYRMDGTYVNSITVRMAKAGIHYIQYYQDYLYADVRGWASALDTYLLLEIDPENGNVTSRSLPISYNKGWNESFFTGHNFFMSRLNDPPRYSQLFMDYIVSVGKETTPYIKLKSKNLVTEQDIAALRGEMWEKYQQIHKRSKVFDVHSFVESDKIILFDYWHGTTTASVLLNKKTGSVELANSFKNDLLYRDDTFGVDFIFSDSKGAYEVPDQYWLPKFQESHRKNEVAPDLDKADQLMKLNEESNPVIFYYEYKDAE